MKVCEMKKTIIFSFNHTSLPFERLDVKLYTTKSPQRRRVKQICFDVWNHPTIINLKNFNLKNIDKIEGRRGLLKITRLSLILERSQPKQREIWLKHFLPLYHLLSPSEHINY